MAILLINNIQVRTRQGLVPVCAWCNRIRDVAMEWHPLAIDSSLEGRYEITHTICPDCSSRAALSL